MDAVLLMSEMFPDEGFRIDGTAVFDFRGLEGTCAYCSPEAEAHLASVLGGTGPEGVHFIDGGDYHYLSEILLRSASEPFELLLWDNHPDDQKGAFEEDGLLSCGSWVKRLRETSPFCRGTHWFRSAEDFDRWHSVTGLPMYLSIDLDVLRREDARTNWDQGSMTLGELCREIRLAMDSSRVIGADICGGISASKGGRACDFSINAGIRQTLYELLRGR